MKEISGHDVRGKNPVFMEAYYKNLMNNKRRESK